MNKCDELQYLLQHYSSVKASYEHAKPKVINLTSHSGGDMSEVAGLRDKEVLNTMARSGSSGVSLGVTAVISDVSIVRCSLAVSEGVASKATNSMLAPSHRPHKDHVLPQLT